VRSVVDNTFRWPDFFIVGAPKSGTTAIASYLNEHPDVLISNPKEPHYFCTDLPLGRYGRTATTREKYGACFSEAGETTCLGEASVFYLYSTAAVPRILEVQPRAKFLVFLRDPVEMAISLHQHFVKTGWEDLPFEDAWACALGKKTRKQIPERCPWHGWLDYRDLCLIGAQTQRLVERTSGKNTAFFLFDWIKEDAGSVYRQILNILNIEDDGRDRFPVINPAQTIRWPTLRRALLPLVRVKRFLGIEKDFGTTWFLRRLNLKRVNPHSAVDEDLRSEMRKEFKEDVVLLERLTGLPVVSMWGFE
jgi:hypothetical protein